MSNILIIDDDEQLGRSIARVVQRAGHTTRLAEHPKEAISAQPATTPDLVIVEVQSSWLAHLATLRCVFEAQTERSVPFVYTVGHRELYPAVGGILRSQDDWLMKPFDPEELVVRVRTALLRSAA